MEKYASSEYAALPDGSERLKWAWEAFVDVDGVTCEQQDAMGDDEWREWDEERRFWRSEVERLDRYAA